ncbi:putative MarR family transcriptional regulator [Actinacidiphila reveromycinica]|uniref:Putative MarR family transcriptional regulator n=1 Tax=Actinacidiphila reveromycinica TaxID=659352 RepID=A0A7U3VS09_9ACTN|nr:MarR family transcriptional regulator [Streptomyces sp. SN-593]BBB01361.1 putative MarR family transcriptional regulator [Streptomyces sp. SN-593]
MDVEDAARLRRASAQLTRILKADGFGVGLTSTEESVLGSIVMHAPIGIGELIKLEQLHSSVLSRAIKRLSQQELVRREKDPGDLRSAYFEPTEAGRRLHRRVMEQRTQLLLSGVAGLTGAQQAALREVLPVLESLVDALR